MSGEISCPKCGSSNVTCSENPHNHVCHACGFSMLPVVSEPDEAAVEAVAQAINGADNEWANLPRTMPHEVWPVHVARAVLATPVVADAFRDAERLRNLAARLGEHPGQTYKGKQIAAMLRGDGA